MSKASNGNDYYYQWAAHTSTIATGMVVPAIIGVGLDRLFGTVVFFAIIGVILGVVLSFWQLIKIAQAPTKTFCGGVDKSSESGDNGAD